MLDLLTISDTNSAVRDELIRNLETAFPAINPKPGFSADELMYNAGQRRVVEFVKHYFKEDDADT